MIVVFDPVINLIVEYPKYFCFPPFVTLEDTHTYFYHVYISFNLLCALVVNALVV